MTEEMPKIEVEDELQRFMVLHNFTDIEQIKKLSVEELLKMDGIGWRMLYYIKN
ncbi:MAG: hypothetical protein IT237_12355 [Bacteroidia bacterium]|nr:hypothetical protein [Bacteroidia bacterium]